MCLKLWGLQTRKSGKRESVSEAKVASDKEEQKIQDSVRSRADFGQGRAKNTRQCPKPSRLRTRKSKKYKTVSEAEQTSDKEERKKQDNVRSRVKFGQGKEKKV